jgi:aspartate/methionine/tyrosine aminotransferase
MQLSPFKLERYFAKYEFTARYLLSSSDCESLTIRDLLAFEPDAHDRFLDHWLGYTESEGAPGLRGAISQLYPTIQPGEVLVHSGAEEAIFMFMHAVLQAGDHLIVHAPCYQSLGEVARGIGCEVTFWRAYEPEGWALDLADLEKNIRSNTRAIVINLPHNPTGYLMPGDQFAEVNRLALENGLVLFSDEVYRESEYDPGDRLPAACDVNDLAVSLGVTSKTYGLPGLRIGWIATHNAEIYTRMALLKDYTTICNSAPSEFLAELALRRRSELARRSVDLILRNLEILDSFFTHHVEKFSWIRPRAGPIAFPRLLGEDVESFCQELVTRANVLLVPGNIFEDTENHFRIGFGRKNLPEAIARLEEFLLPRDG